jgi:hypothetical protein
VIESIKALFFFLFCLGVAWSAIYLGGMCLGLVIATGEARFVTGVIATGLAAVLTIETGSRGGFK